MSKYTLGAVGEAALLLILLAYRAFTPFPPKRLLRYAALLYDAVVLFVFSLILPALMELNASRYVPILFVGGLVLYMCLLTVSVLLEFSFTDRLGPPGGLRRPPWYQNLVFGILFALIFFDCGYLMQHVFYLPWWSIDVLAALGFFYGTSISNVKIGSCPWCGKEVGAEMKAGAFRTCRHCGEPYVHSGGELHRGKEVTA